MQQTTPIIALQNIPYRNKPDMNKLIHLAIAIYVLLSTGCVSNNTQAHKPMDIDLTKEYPVLDLKLSDIADVSYIPLKGNSNAEFTSPPHPTNLRKDLDGRDIRSKRLRREDTSLFHACKEPS